VLPIAARATLDADAGVVPVDGGGSGRGGCEDTDEISKCFLAWWVGKLSSADPLMCRELVQQVQPDMTEG
jgi:hypothetical protein